MKIVIESIQLNNWFNFRGDFDENTFKFKEGVNIIAADNDGGKTKLFNAFKWLISDEIILFNNNKATFTKVSDSNLTKVFNKNEFLQLNLNENSSFGVKLIFKIVKESGVSTYRLLKKNKTKKRS